MNETRTPTQNNALHKYCEIIAESLNDAGYDVRDVLEKMKEGVDIPWTKMRVKEFLFKFIQEKMYGKTSTTELLKHEEIGRIHEVLQRFLGERFHLEYIDFPHEDKKEI